MSRTPTLTLFGNTSIGKQRQQHQHVLQIRETVIDARHSKLHHLGVSISMSWSQDPYIICLLVLEQKLTIEDTHQATDIL
jgi:hypothetical protein